MSKTFQNHWFNILPFIFGIFLFVCVCAFVGSSHFDLINTFCGSGIVFVFASVVFEVISHCGIANDYQNDGTPWKWAHCFSLHFICFGIWSIAVRWFVFNTFSSHQQSSGILIKMAKCSLQPIASISVVCSKIKNIITRWSHLNEIIHFEFVTQKRNVFIACNSFGLVEGNSQELKFLLRLLSSQYLHKSSHFCILHCRNNAFNARKKAALIVENSCASVIFSMSSSCKSRFPTPTTDYVLHSLSLWHLLFAPFDNLHLINSVLSL